MKKVLKIGGIIVGCIALLAGILAAVIYHNSDDCYLDF